MQCCGPIHILAVDCSSRVLSRIGGVTAEGYALCDLHEHDPDDDVDTVAEWIRANEEAYDEWKANAAVLEEKRKRSKGDHEIGGCSCDGRPLERKEGKICPPSRTDSRKCNRIRWISWTGCKVWQTRNMEKSEGSWTRTRSKSRHVF